MTNEEFVALLDTMEQALIEATAAQAIEFYTRFPRQPVRSDHTDRDPTKAVRLLADLLEKVEEAIDLLGHGDPDAALTEDAAQKLGEIIDLLRARTADAATLKFVRSRSDYTDRDPVKAVRLLNAQEHYRPPNG